MKNNVVTVIFAVMVAAAVGTAYAADICPGICEHRDRSVSASL